MNDRPDLADVLRRQAGLLDEARPDAVAKQHAKGRRTARENIADLVEDGTFLEYGGLAVAAQRGRRSLDDLAAATPADGVVVGTGRVAGAGKVAVVAYDYTVLAGTQGLVGHDKTDRLLDVAGLDDLPVVLFAEGGGGRPGDTDRLTVAALDVSTFAVFASHQPLKVGVAAGYCFAGNAALLGCCDVTVGVTGASIGMGGPAMVEAAGLGAVAPGDIGPLEVHLANGVVDVEAPDDAAAVAVARQVLAYGHPADPGDAPDQAALRDVVPENRRQAYDVRAVVDGLFDTGSVLELKARHARNVVTAFARLAGEPVGVLANNPRHGAGAIDAAAATKAAGFLRLCDRMRLPVVSLVDTPGIMVGPAAEQTGTVRAVGELFRAAAALETRQATVVLRKAYGLGAMAMAGASFRWSRLTVAWPGGEIGAMGLEGAVRLAFKKELAAIASDDERREREEQLVALAYAHGKALSAAASFELDDVIDPADTRAKLILALAD